jgi:hypothetical protein
MMRKNLPLIYDALLILVGGDMNIQASSEIAVEKRRRVIV